MDAEGKFWFSLWVSIFSIIGTTVSFCTYQASHSNDYALEKGYEQKVIIVPETPRSAQRTEVVWTKRGEQPMVESK